MFVRCDEFVVLLFYSSVLIFAAVGRICCEHFMSFFGVCRKKM